MAKPPGSEVAVSGCRFRFDFRGTSESLIEAVRSHLGRAGGELRGSATEGAFSLSTPVGAFHGTYAVTGQSIVLEVTDKPFFVPCAAIEARLASYVKESSTRAQPERSESRGGGAPRQ
jgi:hypothetical protein